MKKGNIYDIINICIYNIYTYIHIQYIYVYNTDDIVLFHKEGQTKSKKRSPSPLTKVSNDRLEVKIIFLDISKALDKV